MNKDKKWILGIMLLVFLLIIILALFLSKREQPVENPTSGNNEPIINNQNIFKKIDDYNTFFSIQSTINSDSSIDINTSYIVNEIYVNNDYYFIHCDLIEGSNYYKDEYLLLKLDSNSNNYELTKIDENVVDLEKYAKNYNVQPISIINNNNKYMSVQTSILNVLTTYVNYFKKMLLYDVDKAYNMLSDDTKAKYVDINDFKVKHMEIYSNLSSKIFSLNINEEQDNKTKTYYFEDDNRNKITIYEDSIMNFKISY